MNSQYVSRGMDVPAIQSAFRAILNSQFQALNLLNKSSFLQKWFCTCIACASIIQKIKNIFNTSLLAQAAVHTWIGSLRLLSGILDTSVALTYWISLSPFWLREEKWFDSIGAAGRCSSFLLLTLTGDFGGDSEVGLLTKNYWLNDSGLRKTKLTFLAQYDYVICYKEKQGS